MILEDLPVGALRTPTQTRAWTRAIPTIAKTAPSKPRARAKHGIQTAGPVLVFDTETTIDAAQALTFGSWRFGTYTPGGTLRILEEGLFHADDLADTDPDGYAQLTGYTASHSADIDRNAPGANPVLGLIRREEFATVLFRAIQAGAIIVNFNKPFDLSRIAIAAGAARGRRYGGFSLRVWDNEYSRPRITVKMLNSKSSFTELTWPPKIPLKNGTTARLLDLRSLGFALDATSYTLASACTKWGVAHPKQSVEEHGKISAEYIAYNLADTRATAELSAKMFADLEKHPIEAKPELLMSSASLAKNYLSAMGVRPRLSLQSDFPEPVLGAAMSTFYGGRAECRIRRHPMPVEVHDFTSMYPTVNTLMGLWDHHTAERINVIDTTAETTLWLETITLDCMFDPAAWRRLVGLVQIDAVGDVLPVRARYGLKGDPNATIGVNPYWSSEPQWFTLADVVASTFLTGHPPVIRKAITFEPVGTATGLKPVRLGGDIRIDPVKQDFFKAVIEKRVPVKDQPLGAFLKVLANAGSYGIFAQFDRADLAPGTGPDILVEDGAPGDPTEDSSYRLTTDHPETPGPYAFPPIAAVITGGARLMLAMLERCVTDARGIWVFGDTDSMAIVTTKKGGLIECPGGPETSPNGEPAVVALSFAETAAIRALFDELLNPYNRKLVPQLLKLEYRGMCLAVSAKRYACYTIIDGQIVIDRAKVSEHGLGHLMDPTLQRLTQAQETSSVRSWVLDAWKWMIAREIGLLEPDPAWLDRPAVGRFSVTSTHLWKAFDTYNEGKRWAQQVKPANFLLTIGINPMGGDRGRLVSPYESDPTKWLEHDWYRLANGRPVTIDTDMSGDATKVLVETFRDVLLRHVAHPEAKFLANTGQPCLANTRGQLQRRPTISTGRETIGKEANLIEETQAGLRTDDPTSLYRAVDSLWKLVILALRNMDAEKLLEQAPTTVLPQPSDRAQTRLVIETLSALRLRRLIRTGSAPRNRETRDLVSRAVIAAAAAALREKMPTRSWNMERDEVILEQFTALTETKRRD